MPTSDPPLTATFQNGVLTLSGTLTARTVGLAERECARLVRGDIDVVDGAGVESLDTSGAVFVRRLAGDTGKLRSFGDDAARLIELSRAHAPETGDSSTSAAHTRGNRDLEALGSWFLKHIDRLTDIAVLVVDLVYWSVVGIFNRAHYRRGGFTEQAFYMGATALPIVATIMFLIGAISVLQSAATLESFGASVFVVDMLALGLARELAPLMTAIIISGRSGSAVASEIATMKFTEELDAIRTMGLNPLRFVVVPKLWAMVVCLPLLSIMALGFGLFGGFVVATSYMGLSVSTFFSRLLLSLFFTDILTGLVKSVSFAVIITAVGTRRGLTFSGGADGVGRATTASVVTSIFAIIVMDSIWGIVFYFQF